MRSRPFCPEFESWKAKMKRTFPTTWLYGTKQFNWKRLAKTQREERLRYSMLSKSVMRIKLPKSKRSYWIIKHTCSWYSFLDRSKKIKRYAPELSGLKSALTRKIGSQNTSGIKKKQNENSKKGIEVTDEIRNYVSQLVSENTKFRNLLTQKNHQMSQLNELIEGLQTRELQYQNAMKVLSKEVLIDPLTQIANRRGLTQAFESQKERLDSSSSMALGILDIDNFKLLNDKFGHHIGDEALKFTVKTLKEELVAGSFLARYGGEEFIVLFPNTSASEAQKMLTRVQIIMSSTWFNSGDNQRVVTFSAGVTQYRTNESMEEALKRADKGLYEAKRTGKNRTCLV